MKKHIFAALALTLILALTVSAASPVPGSVVSENRDGRQLIIKTYTLPADSDPSALTEEPFQQEGFLYALLSITKEETPFSESRRVSETVTVETATGDLSAILAELAASIPYDDGQFSGSLALDHTSLKTEATGYTTKSYTVTETKTIEGLDRNDPSYVPQTTVKNGKTLALSNVEWAVQGTSLMGDTLVPTSYMAVATYTGKSSSKVATGYVTTAQYSGAVTAAGIASVTYTVTYLGEEILAEEPAAAEPAPFPWLYLGLAAGLLVLLAAALWLLLRRNTNVYVLAADEGEYERIGRVRLGRRRLFIDLRGMKPYPPTEAVIEIKGPTARRLFGRMLTVRLHNGARTHVIQQSRQAAYWFNISLNENEHTEEDAR